MSETSAPTTTTTTPGGSPSLNPSPGAFEIPSTNTQTGGALSIEQLLALLGIPAGDLLVTQRALGVLAGQLGLTISGSDGKTNWDRAYAERAAAVRVSFSRFQSIGSPNDLDGPVPRATGSFNLGQLALLPYQLTDNQVLELQRQLFVAGYYGATESGPNTPTWGLMDATTERAWSELVGDAMRSGPNPNLDEVLEKRQRSFAPTLAQWMGASVDGTGGLIVEPIIAELTNSARLRDLADRAARSILDRDATVEERARFVSEFQADEVALARTAAVRSHQRNLSALGVPQGVSESGEGYFINENGVLSMGQQMARDFGLVVTSHRRTPERNRLVGGVPDSDHLQGMAVDVAGDRDSMAALAEWARQYQGDGGLFRAVIDEGDHIHLSFNAQARAVPLNLLGNTFGTTDVNLAQRALTAVRDVETGGDYSSFEPRRIFAGTVGPTSERGAYNLTAAQWSEAAHALGLDPARFDESNQDAAASYFLRKALDRYGDLKPALIALRFGTEVADDRSRWERARRGGRTASEYVNEVLSRLGVNGVDPLESAFTTQVATFGGGGSEIPVQTVENLDPAAEAAEFIEHSNPTEAKAVRLGNQFAAFRRIISGEVV